MTQDPALMFCLDQMKLDRRHAFNLKAQHEAYDFGRVSFPHLCHALEQTSWDYLNNYLDIESACEAFCSSFFSIFYKSVPRFRQGQNRFPPWFTSEIRENIKRKASYHRRFEKFGSPAYYQEFRRIRSLLKIHVKIPNNHT